MLLEELPLWLARSIPELSLLLVGIVVEKHYVSRITVFTNVMALNVHFLSLGEVGPLLGLYADVGLLLGGYGFLSYFAEASAGRSFQLAAFYFYSSTTVALIMWTHIGFLPVLVVGAVLQLFAEAYYGWNKLVYTGSRPASLQTFLDTREIKVIDANGRPVWRHLSDYFD